MNDNFNSLLYPLSQLKTIRDNFVRELEKAARGEKTSLAFIKNPLPQKSPTFNNEIFQLMVIGGTVFKKALVKKENNEIKILKQDQLSLPLFKTKETLIKFFCQQLDPQVNFVIINFAFPLQPLIRNGYLDGQLINPSKEHCLRGLGGKIVGQELEKAVFQKFKKKIKISVVNDTICLLFSPLQSKTNHNLKSSIVAAIVGTGTNLAFFLDEKTAVNLESGNFDKFPQTKSGKIIDKKSTNPGKQLFEKEVAGAYLYQHYNLLVSNYQKIFAPLTNSYQLTEIAQNQNHPFCALAQTLFARSASLFACQIAGIYQFKIPKTKNSLEFILEGSLFWQGWNYQNLVKKYLNQLTVPLNHIKFLKIDNSSVIGAANLVLSD